MEDLEVPTVVAVRTSRRRRRRTRKHKLGKARKLQVVLGVRDRDRHVVEILGLEDPATKEKVAPKDVLFVTAGGPRPAERRVVEIKEKKSTRKPRSKEDQGSK